MTCPICTAALNRFDAPDAVAMVTCAHAWGGLEHRARVATVYACPACEFIGTREDLEASMFSRAAKRVRESRGGRPACDVVNGQFVFTYPDGTKTVGGRRVR